MAAQATITKLRARITALEGEVAALKRELARRGTQAVGVPAGGVPRVPGVPMGEAGPARGLARRAAGGVCIHGSASCQALACRVGR